MSELDAVILDLVESKKLSIAALRFIFLRKNQFKRTSLNRPLLFSCPLSKKLGIQMRKIKVGDITYRIRPSFILPYCRAKTSEASKALFLLKFGVPFWA